MPDGQTAHPPRSQGNTSTPKAEAFPKDGPIPAQPNPPENPGKTALHGGTALLRTVLGSHSRPHPASLASRSFRRQTAFSAPAGSMLSMVSATSPRNLFDIISSSAGEKPQNGGTLHVSHLSPFYWAFTDLETALPRSVPPGSYAVPLDSSRIRRFDGTRAHGQGGI